MPLIGYACPPGSPSHGERHEVGFCLGQCPHPCVSPPLLNAIYQAERSNHHQGAYISASMLTGGSCARQTVYERTQDFYEYPINRWWAFRGTIGHALIEGAGDSVAPYGWIQEMRMSVPLVYPDLPQPVLDESGRWTGDFLDEPLTITLGGTTDAYNPLIGELHDFKSAADEKVVMMAQGSSSDAHTFSPQVKDEWVWQTNIYRWLLAGSLIPDEIRERFALVGEYYPAPTKLVIQTFSMMALVRTGSTVEVRVPVKSYGKYAKKEKQLYTIDEVPVLPLAEVEAYIRPRALEWYQYLILGAQPHVVALDKKWMCINCTFNGERIKGERCHPAAERLSELRPLPGVSK